MPSAVESLKEGAAAVREAVIVLVLVLFLVFPSVMKGVLTRAGFTKASIAGFEWELEASAQKTKEAADTVEKLEKDLGAMRQRLESIVQHPAIPLEVKGQIAALSGEVQSSIRETGRVGESLRSNFAVQQELIQKVAPERLERLRQVPREPSR